MGPHATTMLGLTTLLVLACSTAAMMSHHSSRFPGPAIIDSPSIRRGQSMFPGGNPGIRQRSENSWHNSMLWRYLTASSLELPATWWLTSSSFSGRNRGHHRGQLTPNMAALTLMLD